MGSVLVSPLSWGLGHAMRDIPVIRMLLSRGNDVTIAACGNALAALQQEFPACRFIEFRDYPSPYSAGRYFLPKLSLYLPVLLHAISREHEILERIIAKERYDLIISDNRLGVYSSRVPSLFMTHQVHFHLPLFLWPVELFAARMSKVLYRKFNRIIVPDNPPGPLSLAGKLSRPDSGIVRALVYHAGILTSIPQRNLVQDLDYLVLVSGPEPQRTRLEEILLPQARELEGKTVVLLGSPQNPCSGIGSENWSVRNYVSNDEKAALMNRAKFVICRSGYTTMMELAELQKTAGLFIPTPGQPEQEYLSRYYEQKKWFHSGSQYRLDLPGEIDTAREYRGFPSMPSTDENAKRLYDDVIKGFLE